MEKLIKEMNDSHIFSFVVDEKNLFECLDTYKSYLNCKSCKGLNNCKNTTIGYENTLKGLKKCHYKLEKERQDTKNQNLDTMFISKKLLNNQINDFEINNDERRKLISCYSYIINNNIKKGLFIYGGNNQGKTFFLACIANDLKNRGKKVTMCFMPDLIRYLRSIRFDSEIEEKINHFKETDVLMLDDLGVEIYDPWFAFEVLTPILNYRLQEGKMTFFTSNYSFKELLENAPERLQKDYLRLFSRIQLLVHCDTKDASYKIVRKR